MASDRRVINAGGIPQKNEMLNRVYANVLNKPVLVPEGDVDQPGFGASWRSWRRTRSRRSKRRSRRCARAIAPSNRMRAIGAAYEQLYALYRKLYFAFGKPGSEAVEIGDVLPALRGLAAQVRKDGSAA